MTFLGILLDETLTCKKHIQVIENKISKNIGILYKAKPRLKFKIVLKADISHLYIVI